jgi:hypothetical protein
LWNIGLVEPLLEFRFFRKTKVAIEAGSGDYPYS